MILWMIETDRAEICRKFWLAVWALSWLAMACFIAGVVSGI